MRRSSSWTVWSLKSWRSSAKRKRTCAAVTRSWSRWRWDGARTEPPLDLREIVRPRRCGHRTSRPTRQRTVFLEIPGFVPIDSRLAGHRLRIRLPPRLDGVRQPLSILADVVPRITQLSPDGDSRLDRERGEGRGISVDRSPLRPLPLRHRVRLDGCDFSGDCHHHCDHRGFRVFPLDSRPVASTRQPLNSGEFTESSPRDEGLSSVAAASYPAPSSGCLYLAAVSSSRKCLGTSSSPRGKSRAKWTTNGSSPSSG